MRAMKVYRQMYDFNFKLAVILLVINGRPF